MPQKQEQIPDRPFSASATVKHSNSFQFNSDSAVAIGGKREARSFRNDVDGFVPLSKHRSSVLRRDVEFYRNDLTKAKMMLRLQSRTPLLLQDCTSLPAFSV